ncbi:MAG: type II toxin-antitoxin system RelE/ParE family toxin [Candidatus Weimeria sp.]
MNSYKIFVTPDAEADLYEIMDYIANTLLAPEAALNYIRAIRTEIEKLSYMADSIAPEDREPWHSRGVRKIIANNFYVYYRPDNIAGKVYILNVIYAKRDQLRALKNMDLHS